MIHDVFDNEIWPKARVAIAANRGIRIGRVLKINEYGSYAGYTEPSASITIEREMGGGKVKKQTLPYEKEKVYVISNED